MLNKIAARLSLRSLTHGIEAGVESEIEEIEIDKDRERKRYIDR